MIDEKLQNYIESHIPSESEELSALYRRTQLTKLYPRMCSGHHQGSVLRLLTEIAKPRRVLELGTFTGYSTLCLAEGMPEGGVIDTVEIDDEAEDELIALFRAQERKVDIRLHIGDALKIVPELEGEWQLAFIDANKRLYRKYFDIVLPRISKGGIILADNTLWSDKILNETARDEQSKGIREFNEYLASVEGIDYTILPIRDGLTVIYKR